MIDTFIISKMKLHVFIVLLFLASSQAYLFDVCKQCIASENFFYKTLFPYSPVPYVCTSAPLDDIPLGSIILEKACDSDQCSDMLLPRRWVLPKRSWNCSRTSLLGKPF